MVTHNIAGGGLLGDGEGLAAARVAEDLGASPRRAVVGRLQSLEPVVPDWLRAATAVLAAHVATIAAVARIQVQGPWPRSCLTPVPASRAGKRPGPLERG